MKIVKRILQFLKLYRPAVKLYDFAILVRDFFVFKNRLRKLPAKHFFFFPFYHTGGAEWVHLKITEAVNGDKIVFFTHDSANNHFFDEFKRASHCFEIRKFLRNQIIQKWVIKSIVKKVNRKKNGNVFGCHTIHFYELLPKLANEIRKIDLIHAFTLPHEAGAEKYSLPYVQYLDTRVCINQKAKDDLLALFKEKQIDNTLATRIKVIENCPTFECETYPNKPKDVFNIVYVGRNSPEKRIPLIGKIASELKKIDQKFQVILIGENLKEGVTEENRNDCTFFGGIHEVQKLKKIYEQAHVVIITSIREGFPMAIMEGMIAGAVSISTNVGGISEHISNKRTGFLIENNDDNNQLLKEFIHAIQECDDGYSKLSKRAFLYAKETFNQNIFRSEYNNLFNSLVRE